MSAGSKGRQRWSEDDVAALQAMHRRHMDIEQVASELGRSERAVRIKLHSLRPKPQTPSDQVNKRSQRRRSGAAFFLS